MLNILSKRITQRPHNGSISNFQFPHNGFIKYIYFLFVLSISNKNKNTTFHKFTVDDRLSFEIYS